jgi:HEAT repeat protein
MALWALAGVRTEPVRDVLGQTLRTDANAEVRSTAAWALAYNGGPAEVDALTGALGDPVSDVRYAAAWALAQLHIDRAPAALVAMLGDRDANVRLMTTWAISEIGDRAAAAALLDAFDRETSDEVRRAQFRGLLMLGERSRAIIDGALASRDPDLRARAVRLLAGRGEGPWPWPWPWPRPRPTP